MENIRQTLFGFLLSLTIVESTLNTQIARIHWPFIGPSDAARLAHGCKSWMGQRSVCSSAHSRPITLVRHWANHGWGFAFCWPNTVWMCSLQAIDDVFLSHMSTRYSFLICSTMVTVELGLLSLEKVNSSFFVFSVLDYFAIWSSENKRINTAQWQKHKLTSFMQHIIACI